MDWFGLGPPKDHYSLKYVKYLHNILSKNETVSKRNHKSLVENLRSLAETLNWGDKHDPRITDFFIEKKMFSIFLRIMKQRGSGSNYVCVQLLQNLSIIFRNIENTNFLYYLLSNDQVNEIIEHKFDFSNEDVMNFYISFLNQLSQELNKQTINFFYKKNKSDFPLYTEAIKFFKHHEPMVRSKVRLITLNVYRVKDPDMLEFITRSAAAPYFANLVFFTEQQIQDLNRCVQKIHNSKCQTKLSNLILEQQDNMDYLNDIFALKIPDLNKILVKQLLVRLFIPLYISALKSYYIKSFINSEDVNLTACSSPLHNTTTDKMSCAVSLFLLTQVFLIMSEPDCSMVPILAWVILKTDTKMFEEGVNKILEYYEAEQVKRVNNQDCAAVSSSKENLNFTDEEKERVQIVYNALDCSESDYTALVALCLLYAISKNKGVTSNIKEDFLKPRKNLKSTSEEVNYSYNIHLVEKLLFIIKSACQEESVIRLVTLECTLELLLQLVLCDGKNILLEHHKHEFETINTLSMDLLTKFYYSDIPFLDLFEYEFENMLTIPVKFFEKLCKKSALLMPPICIPANKKEDEFSFIIRLPHGKIEKARRAIRVFFLIRRTLLTLNGEEDTQLPLTNSRSCVKMDQKLDLTTSSIIRCTVLKDGKKNLQFLYILNMQLIFIEPCKSRRGWGEVKDVGFLQDVDVREDRDHPMHLSIKIYEPNSGISQERKSIFCADLYFDDNLKCTTAENRLTRGRIEARRKKMNQIARILKIPEESSSPLPNSVNTDQNLDNDISQSSN